MSMRFLIGIVQAFVVPGMRSAASISSTSSSHEIRSGQTRRKTSDFSHSGAHDEYQRGLAPPLGPAASGRTVVSIIENGAGSVEVSARPALPRTRSTSGKDFRSCVLHAGAAGSPR